MEKVPANKINNGETASVLWYMMGCVVCAFAFCANHSFELAINGNLWKEMKITPNNRPVNGMHLERCLTRSDTDTRKPKESERKTGRKWKALFGKRQLLLLLLLVCQPFKSSLLSVIASFGVCFYFKWQGVVLGHSIQVDMPMYHTSWVPYADHRVRPHFSQFMYDNLYEWISPVSLGELHFQTDFLKFDTEHMHCTFLNHKQSAAYKYSKNIENNTNHIFISFPNLFVLLYTNMDFKTDACSFRCHFTMHPRESPDRNSIVNWLNAHVFLLTRMAAVNLHWQMCSWYELQQQQQHNHAFGLPMSILSSQSFLSNELVWLPLHENYAIHNIRTTC